MRNSLKKDYIFQQKDYICIPKNEVFCLLFYRDYSKRGLGGGIGRRAGFKIQ